MLRDLPDPKGDRFNAQNWRDSASYVSSAPASEGQTKYWKPVRSRGETSSAAHLIFFARPKIKFLERHDSPSFCLIKAVCALALMDGAFSSSDIKTSKDLYPPAGVPGHLNAIPLTFNPEWRNVPLFRRSLKGQREVSLMQAI